MERLTGAPWWAMLIALKASTNETPCVQGMRQVEAWWAESLSHLAFVWVGKISYDGIGR